MNKLESVEKDIIQASVELNVNKGLDKIHKEQNNIENLPIENIDSEEVVHHSLEIKQEDESEQSDITSQENKVLSESSDTDEALEKVELIIDRLRDEDSTENSNENDQSEPIDNTPTKEQNVVDEIHDEKKVEEFKQEDENQEDNREIDENTMEDAFLEVSTSNTKEEGSDDIVTEVNSEKEAKTEVNENDEQKDNQELSFDEIVSKILTKEIKTNKDFRRVIEGRWAFKRGKTDRDLIPAIKAGKINDSEYDQELVKKNITKLLKKVN